MFRPYLSSGTMLKGVFVKTPATEVIECLAKAKLDFICLDAEHAAWDRRSLDQCLGMACALDMSAFVRIAALRPDACLQALDGGATGIVAPHVRTAKDAEALVRWCRFGPGGRGYSGSTRAAGLRGTPMPQVLAQSAPIVIPQIEDADALENLDAIARVPGLDALFVGAADLSVSLGQKTTQAEPVRAATQAIRTAAAKADLAVAAFVTGLGGLAQAELDGTKLAFVGSDQTLIMDGARALSKA